MTSQKRVLTALEHKIPHRCPCNYIGPGLNRREDGRFQEYLIRQSKMSSKCTGK